MGSIEKTVFISYRHTIEAWAVAISQNLTQNGFDVFIDFKNINSGDFAQVITENIKARAHFLVLLAPSVLEGCEKPNDWLRFEIELALESKRNIIPIMLEGFDFGAPETLKYLTGELNKLKSYNGLKLFAYYFEEGMQRLCSRFLNIPLDAVLHPISQNVQKIVNEQKSAIADEPKVEERILTAQEWFEKGHQSKDLDEKIRCNTNSIELDPEFALSYNNRAFCYATLGQHKRAIEDYDQVIKLKPEFALSYNNRGVSLAKLGEYERAFEDYDMAIRLAPDDEARNYYNKASCYALQGKIVDALIWLRKSMTKNAEKVCELVRNDSDFVSIWDEEEYKNLLEEFCNKSKQFI